MINYTLRRWFAAGVVGCLCMVLTSCGSGRYEPIPETGASLTGTVTYKKEPLKIGMVIVAGKTGATGEIGEDGRYKVENVPLGEVTVAINMAAAQGKLMGMAAAGKSKGPLPKVPNLPGKYTDPAKSPLKTTINPGANTFDIVIE